MIEISLLTLFSDNEKEAQVYIDEIPLNGALPAVLISLESSSTTYAQASKNIVKDEFEVGCYAASALEAAELSSEIVKKVDGYKGDMSGIQVTLARCTNKYALQEKQSDSFARIFTLFVNYIED